MPFSHELNPIFTLIGKRQPIQISSDRSTKRLKPGKWKQVEVVFKWLVALLSGKDATNGHQQVPNFNQRKQNVW